MEHIVNWSYTLDYDKSNPQNQIIFWKIENYNSYLTDFEYSKTEHFITFKTQLEGKSVIFTYYPNDKIINVENLTNEQLIQGLDEINGNDQYDIYQILTKIETLIENMPEESEVDEEPETYAPAPIFSNLKANQLVNKLNDRIGFKQSNPLTVYDTTIYDDFEKFDNLFETSQQVSQPKKEIKVKLLSDVEATDSDSLLNLSGSNIPSISTTTESDDILNDKDILPEYLDKYFQMESQVNQTKSDQVEQMQEDISDIMIQCEPVQSNIHETLSDDPFAELILSDSDFTTFYENLNVKAQTCTLNEKEILEVSTKLLKEEPPITDEQMKKYAFGEVPIVKMVIKEIYKCMENPFIQIKPNQSNVFDLDITIKKECWEKTLCKDILTNDVVLNFKLPKLYYPYAPPQIQIQSPKFSDMFLFSINSLDYLKQEFWNPSNTLAHTLEGLIQIFSQHSQLEKEDSTCSDININNQVILLWANLGIKSEIIDFKIDFTKLSGSNTVQTKSTMASGTGYGNDSYAKFDMKKFMADKKNKSKDIVKSLDEIYKQFETNHDKISCELVQSKLSGILHYYLFDVNILEITNKLSEYALIIGILEKIKPLGFANIKTGSETLENLVKQLGITIHDYNKLSNSDQEMNSLGSRVNGLVSKQELGSSTSTGTTTSSDKAEITYDDLKERQFESADITSFSSKLKADTLSSDSSRRIMREFSSLKKSLPFNYESSVFFRYDESSMNKIKFLITGPKDTPYQDGCFVFEMVLPPTYPKVCPQVQIITTGRGSVRFNPNLYNCGKVCLSLLGTWSGRPEEAWNENSTMLQLFVSIQSLILIDHPYFNEPGYQSSYGTPHGMERSAKYNEDVQANNIKWAIIDAITNPDPCFADIIKTHFKLKKNDIIQMATEWGKKNSRVQSQLDTLKSVLSKL